MVKNETSLILPVTPEFVERRIYLIRGQKVMMSRDLAELYQVEPRILIQATKRNIKRFPIDFMFQLNRDELANLRSQFVISSWGGSRYTPYAFTELGVAMLSSVLNSDRSIQMNIFIMRAFVKLRELLVTHKELAEKIGVLEKEQREQGGDITQMIIAINRLTEKTKKLENAQKPKLDAIGFQVK